MSDALKVMLENVEQLSTKEKALAAHCLLTAMDTKIDSDVESEWVKLCRISQRRARVWCGKKH